MKRLRIAMLGFEHVHAVSMYDAFSRYPDRYELLGCAEPPPKEGEIPEDPEARRARILPITRSSSFCPPNPGSTVMARISQSASQEASPKCSTPICVVSLGCPRRLE